MSALTRIALAAILASPVASWAQSAPLDQALSVPTTKMLAIGSFTPQATPQAWKPLIPAEMRQTAQLYLAGKLDQWYVKQDQSGVVFILNVTDPADAKAMLDPLPLGRAGFMTFQFIPLGPLSPMRTLLGGAPRECGARGPNHRNHRHRATDAGGHARGTAADHAG